MKLNVLIVHDNSDKQMIANDICQSEGAAVGVRLCLGVTYFIIQKKLRYH